MLTKGQEARLQKCCVFGSYGEPTWSFFGFHAHCHEIRKIIPINVSFTHRRPQFDVPPEAQSTIPYQNFIIFGKERVWISSLLQGQQNWDNRAEMEFRKIVPFFKLRMGLIHFNFELNSVARFHSILHRWAVLRLLLQEDCFEAVKTLIRIKWLTKYQILNP